MKSCKPETGKLKPDRYKVRATDLLNRVSDSICSGNIYLQNALISIAGESSEINLGATYIDVNIDMNNDGHNELIFINGTHNFSRGYVAIKLGGPNMQDRKIYYYYGDYSGDSLIYAYRYVSDFNGDGYPDLILANYHANPPSGANAGTIWVIFGGNTLAESGEISQVGRRYDGSASNDKLGITLNIQDFTGDGVIDFASANSWSGTGNYGVLHFIPGGTQMPPSGTTNTVAYRYHGTDSGEYVGNSLSVADVTGDGIPELFSAFSGGVDIIEGSKPLPASGPAATALKRYSKSTGFNLYMQTPLLYDFDNDGILDIGLTGTAGSYPNQYSTFYVIKGQTTLPAAGAVESIYHRRYTGPTGGFVSFKVANLNCDAYPDIVGGNYDYNSDRGRIGILLGASSMPASNAFFTAASRIYTGTNKGEKIGDNLYGNDINGDGCDDLHGGNYNYAANGLTNSGSGFYLLGASTLPASGNPRTQGRVFEGSYAEDKFFSISLQMIDDVTGDGNADWIASGTVDRGVLFGGIIGIIPGPFPASGTILARGYEITGRGAYDWFGQTRILHDFNGDGIKDIIACGANDKGAIYLILGGTLATGTVGVNVGYRYEGDYLGDKPCNTLMLKDMNRDGILDIVGIGASSPPGKIGAGSVYIIYGTNSAPPASAAISSIGVRIDGDFAGDSFGSVTSESYKDFNNDGFEDLIFISPLANPNGITDAGSI